MNAACAIVFLLVVVVVLLGYGTYHRAEKRAHDAEYEALESKYQLAAMRSAVGVSVIGVAAFMAVAAANFRSTAMKAATCHITPQRRLPDLIAASWYLLSSASYSASWARFSARDRCRSQGARRPRQGERRWRRPHS